MATVLSATTALATAPNYVQGSHAVPQRPQSAVIVPYRASQTAGNLNVVIVGWNDFSAHVSSLTDSSGNVYQWAVCPTELTGGALLSQAIYYAKNISAAVAGANTVTVRFNAAAIYADIRILEYSGIDPVSPVDVVATATGRSATRSSGAVITNNAMDLLVGANIVYPGTTGPGSGFTQRLLTNLAGDSAEDRVVPAADSYSASASLISSGPWMMHMVAFRTAGPPTLTPSPTPTPTTTPTGTPTASPSTAFYISPSGPLGNGMGSSAANAADASTAVKYAAIVKAQNTPGETIFYAAGTYHTTGNLQMNNGVTHQGLGIGSTIIQLSSGTGTITAMFWGNCTMSTIIAFTASDMTIDFNASNQAWWNPISGTGASSGFLFPDGASFCTIQRVKFINMGAQHRESFPIFFGDGCSSGIGNVNHNTINGCIFTHPIVTGSSTGGLTCICMTAAEPGMTVDNTNIVKNCQFLNLAKPTYSDLAYTQCVAAPVAINNTATSVDAFWYLEPGSSSLGNNVMFTGETVQVTGNTLINAGMIAFINFHPNGTFAGNLNVQNNTVGMSQSPYGYPGPLGVKIQTNGVGNPGTGNIMIKGNKFIAPLPKGVSPCAVYAEADPVSGWCLHMASMSIISNVFTNFPHDGNEYRVTTNPVYNPNYTNSTNIFSK